MVHLKTVHSADEVVRADEFLLHVPGEITSVEQPASCTVSPGDTPRRPTARSRTSPKSTSTLAPTLNAGCRSDEYLRTPQRLPPQAKTGTSFISPLKLNPATSRPLLPLKKLLCSHIQRTAESVENIIFSLYKKASGQYYLTVMNNIVSLFPRLGLALLSGISFLTLPCVEGASIVNNGSFESTSDGGSPIPTAPFAGSGWTATQTATDTVSLVGTGILYNLAPQNLEIAAAFGSEPSSTGNGASLSQMLTTVATQYYDLSFWLANPVSAAISNNVFSVSWGGSLISLSGANLTLAGSNQYKVGPDDTKWYHVTALGLAPTGTSTDLTFSARNNEWQTLVDNVSVTPSVPDGGSTIMFLALAVIGLAFGQRSAQRNALF